VLIVLVTFLADIQDSEPIPQRATVRIVKQPPGRLPSGHADTSGTFAS
jgi:hypothetical protein